MSSSSDLSSISDRPQHLQCQNQRCLWKGPAIRFRPQLTAEAEVTLFQLHTADLLKAMNVAAIVGSINWEVKSTCFEGFFNDFRRQQAPLASYFHLTWIDERYFGNLCLQRLLQPVQHTSGAWMYFVHPPRITAWSTFIRFKASLAVSITWHSTNFTLINIS